MEAYQIKLQSVGVSFGYFGSVTTNCIDAPGSEGPAMAVKSVIARKLLRLVVGTARAELAARIAEAIVSFIVMTIEI